MKVIKPPYPVKNEERDMSSLAVLEEIVHEFPEQLQTPIRHLTQWAEEHLKVPREDFLRLEATVERLVVAQEHTEHQMKELAAAQSRTE